MQEEIGGYSLPDIEEVVIDTTQNKIVDNKSLTPWEMIDLTAKQNNIALNKPKDDCKKCYGRGYISFHAGIPNPCHCIFPKETLQQEKNRIWLNRGVKRHLEKEHFAEGTQDKKNRMKEMNLIQVDKTRFKNKTGKLFEWDGKNFLKING